MGGDLRHVAMGLAYDGRAYAGFQRQSHDLTIQQFMEGALEAVVGHPTRICAAGRTDAGVSAWGQVIDAHLAPGVPTARLPLAVSAHLPADIRVTWAMDVGPGFHPRFSAISKRYRYLIWRPPVRSPFWWRQSWHYAGPLDVEAMAAAAARFVGRHDVSAIAGAGRPVRDPVRTIFACDVEARGPWLAIAVEANGFLYRMVRAIAGTLWDVGRGALTPGAVDAVLDGGRRADAGPTLPPYGLSLLRVRYAPEWGVPDPVPPMGPPPMWG